MIHVIIKDMTIRLDIVNAIMIGVGGVFFVLNVKDNPAAAWAWLFVAATNAFSIIKDKIFAKVFNKYKDAHK